MGLFDIKPKSKRLARIISIKSPQDFIRSIRIIKKGGVTLQEKRALVLAQNRARAILKKKISLKERIEFIKISKIKLPKITR